MKKKVVSLLLTVCMMTVLLTGCVGESEENAKAETTEESAKGTEKAGEFTIGMRFPMAIDQMQQQTMDNVTELVETAGGSLLVENAALTPEGNIQAYERLIAAGVDGLAVIPAADSVSPESKKCVRKHRFPGAFIIVVLWMKI